MENQEQIQADQQLAKLEMELAEANAADNFFETASGKVSLKIASLEIEKIIKDISSDKYLKDHVGYVNALADLRAMRKWQQRIQKLASPKVKEILQHRLEELKDGPE